MQPKVSQGTWYQKCTALENCIPWKSVWAVSTKQDSVWPQWISLVYLEEEDWWNYVPTSSASQYWRKVYNVKELLKLVFTQYELSNMSTYYVKAIYDKLSGEQTSVACDIMVYNRLGIPEHRFVIQLALQAY